MNILDSYLYFGLPDLQILAIRRAMRIWIADPQIPLSLRSPLIDGQGYKRGRHERHQGVNHEQISVIVI